MVINYGIFYFICKFIISCGLLSNYFTFTFTSPFSIPLHCERKAKFPFRGPPTRCALSWRQHSVHFSHAWQHLMPLLHQNAAKNSETKKKYKDSEDVYMQVNMLKKNSPAQSILEEKIIFLLPKWWCEMMIDCNNKLISLKSVQFWLSKTQQKGFFFLVYIHVVHIRKTTPKNEFCLKFTFIFLKCFAQHV